MKLIAITEKAHNVLRRSRVATGIAMGRVASMLIVAIEKTPGASVSELVLSIMQQNKK